MPKLNFGEYVFDQTMKHVDSFVVKLPIAFPCLISGIIFNQHPNIVNTTETPNKKAGPLTLNYRLFVGTHVPDIVVKKHQVEAIVGDYSPVSITTIKDVLLDLIEVSKALQETITASTIRKKNVDGFIKMLTKEKEVEGEKKTDSEEEEQFASDEEAAVSEFSSEEE